MKTYRTLSLALTVLFGLGASHLHAQSPDENPFEIRSVKREKKYKANVDNGWRDGAPCISMDIRVTKDASDKPYARAYFFDKDGNVLAKVKEPTMVSDTGENYTSMPASFAVKKWAPVSFAVPNAAERWMRVVVVFGNKTYATAEAYPTGELKDFKFEEKELVLKSVKK